MPGSVLACIGLTMPSWALADTSAVPGISAGTIVQTLLALLVIVGLLAGTAWFARKVAGGRGFGQGGMKTLGGITLGPRERIVLVEVGDTWLVIGIVPGQIRTLHTMAKGTFIDNANGGSADQPFAQWLKQIVERPNGPKKNSDA